MTLSGGDILVNPDMDMARELKVWWDNEGYSQETNKVAMIRAELYQIVVDQEAVVAVADKEDLEDMEEVVVVDETEEAVVVDETEESVVVDETEEVAEGIKAVDEKILEVEVLDEEIVEVVKVGRARVPLDLETGPVPFVQTQTLPGGMNVTSARDPKKNA